MGALHYSLYKVHYLVNEWMLLTLGFSESGCLLSSLNLATCLEFDQEYESHHDSTGGPSQLEFFSLI